MLITVLQQDMEEWMISHDVENSCFSNNFIISSCQSMYNIYQCSCLDSGPFQFMPLPTTSMNVRRRGASVCLSSLLEASDL
jgi:hypothetical protein